MTGLTVYPLSNYAFAVKAAQPEEDATVNARLARLQHDYGNLGMRRTDFSSFTSTVTVSPAFLWLILRVHAHEPGDYLKPDEGDIKGLEARLERRLGQAESKGVEKSEQKAGGWVVKDLIAQWWRPNYEGFMYPYIPAHVANPKEVKSIYLCQLPERSVLAVPQNMKLVAVPLFELYDNAVRYGPLLSAVPHLLSKYEFIYRDGVRFLVHKANLASGSTVFASMFASTTGEEKEEGRAVIGLAESSNVLKALLPYFYPRRVKQPEIDFSDSDDLEFIACVDKYEVWRAIDAIAALCMSMLEVARATGDYGSEALAQWVGLFAFTRHFCLGDLMERSAMDAILSESARSGYQDVAKTKIGVMAQNTDLDLLELRISRQLGPLAHLRERLLKEAIEDNANHACAVGVQHIFEVFDALSKAGLPEELDKLGGFNKDFADANCLTCQTSRNTQDNEKHFPRLMRHI
ncbi:cleavage and polyadenylation specific factor 5 [Pseudohyphozyma bogoriensis]|nr:cleavage and polyadenylation specific factor 5 [Pseudohyphozyma bogoriensis]